MTDNLYYKTNFSNLLVRVRGTRDCGQILECHIMYLRYRTDHSDQIHLSLGLGLVLFDIANTFGLSKLKLRKLENFYFILNTTRSTEKLRLKLYDHSLNTSIRYIVYFWCRSPAISKEKELYAN